jgi:hypothetical protein
MDKDRKSAMPPRLFSRSSSKTIRKQSPMKVRTSKTQPRWVQDRQRAQSGSHPRTRPLTARSPLAASHPPPSPPAPQIEFRVVFRSEGRACDPFATYSPHALHAALQYALPATMTGILEPSTDSKGQPAVLVRAHASDMHTMYELRAQVVSGDFMIALTRALRAHVKEERRSIRQEQSKRAEQGVAPVSPVPDSPPVPAKDEDLEGIDMGATDMTVYDEDTVWEKLRLMLPWQEGETDSAKATKKELSLARAQLKERRQQVAELEARVNELTERLAVESADKAAPPDDIIKKEEKNEAVVAPTPAPVRAEKKPLPPAIVVPPQIEAGPVAANHVALEDLTPQKWEMIKQLKAAYVAHGGELDEYGDIFILRFLIDKDWKYSSAEKKAKSTAAWRIKVGANAMRKRIAAGQNYADIPNIKELFTTVAVANGLCRTKAGDLITIIDYGSLNVDAFFKKLNNAEYFDINTYILEFLSYRADKLTQETGALVRQAMVVDAGGIGLGHVSLRMFIRFKPIMPLADLYYPELLGCARVLNAAWALHQGWKLVKPLLSKQIQDMVGILDSSKTQGALLKIADADVIPDYLGGTATTIRRPALDWYPKDASKGVDLDMICPGKKLGAFMRRTLAPNSTKIAGVPDDAPKGFKPTKK